MRVWEALKPSVAVGSLPLAVCYNYFSYHGKISFISLRRAENADGHEADRKNMA